MTRPNFLIISADQHRADCLGIEGRRIQTPHLDQLARDGTRFLDVHHALRRVSAGACVNPDGPVVSNARCSRQWNRPRSFHWRARICRDARGVGIQDGIHWKGSLFDLPHP